MTYSSSVALAVALMILPAGMAQAQFGGRGGMRNTGGGLPMLRIPAVQKELNLTPAQIAELDAKDQAMQTQIRAQFQGGFANLTPEERQQRMEKIQDLQDAAVADILLERYKQLELQQQGPVAITRKSVAADLKLTDDQQKKVADIQTQANADMRAAMQGVDFQNMSDDDRKALMTKMQDARKAEGDKLLALLTDTQKAQWKDMQGTPFTFPAPGATAPTPAVTAPAPTTTAAPAAKP